MIHQPCRKRGFILLTSLIMLAVVAMALTVLRGVASQDGNRTLDQYRRAQLEQMLLAGTADAIQRFNSTTPVAGESWNINLPQQLAENHAQLRTNIASIDADGRAVVTIRAQMDNNAIEQMIQLRRENSGWRITHAELSS